MLLITYYICSAVLTFALVFAALQADSGYDAALYTALSVAPVLLLDGRPKGTSEHAGFAQLAAAGEAPCCLSELHPFIVC